MSKMKKLIVGIITLLIGIFGMYSISNAYYVGQSVLVTFNDYEYSNNIYCMEHGQSLTSDNYYTVVSNVKIDGTKSTDHTGKEIDNKANAKFAYILNAKNSYYKSSVSNAVWNYGSTWMSTVGRHHEGLYSGFASDTRGTDYKTDIETQADNYANNFVNEKTAPEDKTDKAKIKVQSYQKDGKQYIRVGTFKWNFGGTLTEIKAFDQDGKEISGILYSKFEGNTEKFISAGDVKSGKEFYISIPADKGVSKITKLTGKENIDKITANIWFLESTAGYKQNLLICDTDTKQQQIEMSFDYNIVLQGNLKVIKVNKDNETIKLQGVSFYIQNKETGKYVNSDNGKISYVDKDKATEFFTDKNGEIIIKNLIVGTYVAYETKNPNYGYEIISDGKEKEVTVDKTAELKIPNKQIYVKLSGYVWVDKISEKQDARNNLYNDGDHDQNDTLLDGITVKLKNRATGETVKESKTADGGAYKFIDVLIEDLDKYYIEFEYDGLTYTNVIPHTDKNNGSKSAENTDVRTNFNNNFAVVEGKSNNTSITRDDKGNEKHTITYNIEDHVAKVDKTKSYYEITANTDETGYKIKDHFTYGQEEVKYINLGLYERDMPDIAVMKDLYDVKMTINGKAHVYEYAQRFLNAGEYGDGFNVGVKFGNKYGNMSYSRPVYKEDYTYEAADKSQELKVYVTYQISMKNQSTDLKAKVNSIVDYYDARYNLIKVGTGAKEGNITGDMALPESSSYNEKYKKAVINLDKVMEPQEGNNIYLQFELNREAVLNILNDKENLDNVVEINSYSIYDKDGKTYAGIDSDSNPGNAVPGDKNTYEDDTDSAPGLKLEVAGHSRNMTGKVFLDGTDPKLMTGKERLGSGEYDTGEKGIEGVEVTLTEKNTGIKYETKTNGDGDFTIKEFIPGDYTLTYRWGDDTYTVQDYKATIWTPKNRAEKQENGTSWYKVNTDTRYSDAMDDYELRQKIDAGEEIDKMNSITPEMNIEIEITTTTTTTFDDKFIPEGYNVENVDFGIVERPRQSLDISKRIKTFKVTLAKGQVIVDATIDDDGNLVGTTNNIIYMKPGTTSPINGKLWLQLDSELLAGAKVQVGYKITVANNSEKDFANKNYYMYGEDYSNPITITPSGVYDYLEGMEMDSSKDNKNWEIVSEQKYVSEYTGPTIVEEYFIDERSSNIDEDGNLIEKYSWKTSREIYEEFREEWTGSMTTTSLDKEAIRQEKLKNKVILHNAELEKPITAGESNEADLYTAVDLGNSDEIDLNNDVEITKVEKNPYTGRDITTYNSILVNSGEEITITPPTGENNNYILIITTVAVALVILGVGVILIKKKTL